MKLYVGNLPWSIDDKALKELFSAYGEIEDYIKIKDKFSGRSKGFGFVTFANEEDAKKAIGEMHEKEVEGRPLTVSEAKPMVPRDNNFKQNNDAREEESSAPMANPSQINSSYEKEDVSSESEEVSEMDTVEEAKEDASSDAPATENATDAEETKEKE